MAEIRRFTARQVREEQSAKPLRTAPEEVRHEVYGTPAGLLDDVTEVSCYVDAMEHGLRLIDQGEPLSLRLIREIHARLTDDWEKWLTFFVTGGNYGRLYGYTAYLDILNEGGEPL